MCEPNDFYLRVFTFWFDTEKALFQVILGLLLVLLSINVCRLRERGRMSKSVYVRVVHDLELLRYVLCSSASHHPTGVSVQDCQPPGHGQSTHSCAERLPQLEER